MYESLSPVQTDSTLLDSTCCVRLNTLLHIVCQCWELLREFARSFKENLP